MTKNANLVALGNNELPFDERLANAKSADEINAIFYEKEPGMIMILEKFQASPMLYHLVASQLESIKRNLVQGYEYEASELISDEWWSERDFAWKREMELCIKHFAAIPHWNLTDKKTGRFMLAD